MAADMHGSGSKRRCCGIGAMRVQPVSQCLSRPAASHRGADHKLIPVPTTLPMASADLSRRVEKVVGYPPLSEMGEPQRRDFHEALLDADDPGSGLRRF
jgi:hypothetical protein